MGRLNASCVDEIAVRLDWRVFLVGEKRFVNQLIAELCRARTGWTLRRPEAAGLSVVVELVLVERALGKPVENQLPWMHQKYFSKFYKAAGNEEAKGCTPHTILPFLRPLCAVRRERTRVSAAVSIN